MTTVNPSISAPSISICMPTYNQGQYIRQAVESLLAQSRPDFELVIYDDASTDNTEEIVATLQDPRIRYFRQDENVGVAANRNSCLSVARGRYIAWVDSDDLYDPRLLAMQSRVLDRYPNVGLVHCAFEVIDSEGKRLPDWHLPFAEDTIERGMDAFRELVVCNYVMHPVMVRRSCLDHVGSYATDIGRSSTDWEMWLRIALHADLAYVATPLSQYRQHETSISSTTAGNGERLRCDIKTIERIFHHHQEQIPDAKRMKRQAQAALAVKTLISSGDAFTQGERKPALALALQLLRLVYPKLSSKHLWLLLVGLGRGHEYHAYRHSKALLGHFYQHLAGTRYGDRIRKVALTNPEWEETLREVAQTVRHLTPAHAAVAVVDKYDPTLLHLSRRRGWHFPDRKLLPGGYPADNATAIEHLEQLRELGAEYIVFPSAAFWWLDYYDDFRQHLDISYQRAMSDEKCIIYHLS